MVLSGNPPDTLYLTVGDQGYNGLALPDLAQDPQASWGKVMKIDLKSGAATIFTSGHRNPQGIFLDDLGRMWLTEQGPRGGDELNLLQQGKNYGWALVTFGTEYDTYDPWPLSKDPGRHGGFELPVYAWVPSIGVTDIIRLQGDRFPLWKGDLLAGSLAANSLFRIHIRQGRAIVVEPIAVSKRIRDMAEGPNGEIVLWTDNFRLIFIEPVPNPEWPEAESAMPY
jgi:glucose/arabinose dehydrogenase